MEKRLEPKQDDTTVQTSSKEAQNRIEALQKQLEIATQASTKAFSEQREASGTLRNLKRQIKDLSAIIVRFIKRVKKVLEDEITTLKNKIFPIKKAIASWRITITNFFPKVER